MEKKEYLKPIIEDEYVEIEDIALSSQDVDNFTSGEEWTYNE